ncbi:copper chaperone PCu(A)C [Oceaniglobus trochenteri]|uniref:copper chaperone PCu(A)C n=1 Tax=Oceaniglobus trochenteri TaxID=2763260 RepID=UPI001CFF54FA|nr:copper chaperone PCu(A)C [Oceaniglobus trochenteri]
MTLRRRIAILLTLALLAGGALFLALRPAPVPIRAEGATAVPLTDEPGTLRLFMTLHNDGGADRLTGASSPLGGTIGIVAPGDGITLPAESAPILAMDGAHLRLSGLEEMPGDGAVLPLTLQFASGARVSTRAVLSDPMARGAAGDLGLLSLGGICRVGEGEPAPQLRLSVTPDGTGWTVTVESDDFTFSEPMADMGHIPGYGHGHLYVDGVKLQRMYAPTARIGALPEGAHLVEVTLNTNDHRAYVVNDRPVTASVTLEVARP